LFLSVFFFESLISSMFCLPLFAFQSCGFNLMGQWLSGRIQIKSD
jgi:hypothetical protein